jgi:hypothetical protein
MVKPKPLIKIQNQYFFLAKPFFLKKIIFIEITTLFPSKTFFLAKPTYPPIIVPTYALEIVYFD